MKNLQIKDLVLPSSYTKQQNEEMLLKKGQGDKNARDNLIIHNQRLVLKVALRYAKSDYELEEYFSEGIIGLVNAVDKFDVSKVNSVSFSNYAYTSIENQIKRLRDRTKNTNRDVASLDTTFLDIDSEDDDINMLALVREEKFDIDQKLMDEKNYIALYKALENLNPEELTIIQKMYTVSSLEKLQKVSPLSYKYGNDYKRISQRQIAKILNCSRTKVGYLHADILKKLYEELKEKIVF